MSNQRPVISLALVTGEEIESEGLPILKVYVEEEKYILVEGIELIESALSKSIQHLEEPYTSVVFLAVELIPVTQRRRRRGEKRY